MMGTINESSFDNLRFFSNSCLFAKTGKDKKEIDNDPMPLGLSLQEPYQVDTQLPANSGGTMAPSPTNTITGSDSCLDIDIEF